MHILPLSLKETYNTKFTALPKKLTEYALPKTIKRQKELKNIVDTPCACCGKKVIVAEVLEKAYENATQSLAKMMEKGFLNHWKQNPLIWGVLKIFSETYPDKSLDKIISEEKEYSLFKKSIFSSIMPDYDNQPPTREQGEVFGKMKNAVLNSSRAEMKGASQVIKGFEKFKKYLDGTQLEVFEQLQIYAQKYPKKTLKEIVNDEEIFKYHQLKDLLQRASVNEQREFHFENIKKILKSKNPDITDEFDDIKDETKDKLCNVRDLKARLYNVKELYKGILKKYGCEKLEAKVLAELDKIPLHYATADSFFVYAKTHELSDTAILNNIFSQYISTFEHIVPRSASKDDSIYNGIVLCSKCNNGRSNIPYTTFLKYHPEMVRNMQKQVDFISDLIIKDKVDKKLSFWPIRVTEKMKKYTQNGIEIDVKGYCQKAQEKIEKNNKKIAKNIDRLKKKKIEAEIREIELRNELSKLQSEITGYRNEITKNAVDKGASLNLLKEIEQVLGDNS